MDAHKLHRNLCEAVVSNLMEIFHDGRKADKVIERALKQNPKWGARDRSFIAETTYEIVRWYRLLCEGIMLEPNKPEEWWKLLAVYLLRWQHDKDGKDFPFPPWPEFQKIDQQKIYGRLSHVSSPLLRESVTEWFYETGLKSWGDRWDNILKALNVPAYPVLRVNGLKATDAEVMRFLEAENIRASRIDENCIRIDGRRDVFRTAAFKDGWFELQDWSSQQVGKFAAPKAGMRVIDACAGAGGKSLHLADLMQNKGQIIALDTEGWKLEELKRRARRAGAHIIQTKLIEGSKTIKRLENSCDILLLDVPCTGSGVIKRNPDSKWRIDERFFHTMLELQESILNQYASMLKKGGHLVYVTCSLFKEEGSDQVTKFLANNPSFTLVEDKYLLPDECNFDAFYLAKLTRIA